MSATPPKTHSLDSPSRPADPVVLVGEILLATVPVALLLILLAVVVRLIVVLGQGS